MIVVLGEPRIANLVVPLIVDRGDPGKVSLSVSYDYRTLIKS